MLGDVGALLDVRELFADHRLDVQLLVALVGLEGRPVVVPSLDFGLVLFIVLLAHVTQTGALRRRLLILQVAVIVEEPLALVALEVTSRLFAFPYPGLLLGLVTLVVGLLPGF